MHHTCGAAQGQVKKATADADLKSQIRQKERPFIIIHQ